MMACNLKTTVADWSGLPQELVVSIAKQIAFLEDFVAFGAVCKSWRSAAPKENFTSRLKHQGPFLMLPQEHGAAIRKIYSFTDYKVRDLNLPEAEGKVCCSCSGWLITLQGLQFNLLHPLNRSQIKLPGFRDSSAKLSPVSMTDFHAIKKFVLSSNPAWTSDYTIMLLYDCKQLAFCKPRQDRYWTSMDLGSHPVDITCYKGRFYAVSHNGRVSVFDIENPTKEAKTEVVVSRMPRELLVHISPGRVKYLVESAGDLLVVSAHEEGYEPAPKFRVFKVPLRDGNWQLDSEVKDLGNRTLFLGDNNTSFSVLASDYSGCEPNCIYFFSYISQQYIYSRQPHNYLLPSRQNIDIGIFHVKNGRIQEHFYWEQRRFPTFGTPCLWIQPKFLEGNSCFAPTTNKVTGSYRKKQSRMCLSPWV
ncbi:PREDICTED: F-box protein SKIP23-like [Prunus mume]|uniref:F-box protein SKIP23-like n=1 Tax=Prunus mume TaxID=102107 RepID=A0ABM0PUL1_PRUMU|nr:PREDICTED: F-box protein SKIP23-like [Prunus mume]XP_008244711.1 PREDICTED: F-box protein SKIP23-like [Prunus mume]